MRTRIKCKSGLTGWQGHLREQYQSFAEFARYDEIYMLATKLGFGSASEAWGANPIVHGSTNPADYCRAGV